jgi:hypothetical protein
MLILDQNCKKKTECVVKTHDRSETFVLQGNIVIIHQSLLNCSIFTTKLYVLRMNRSNIEKWRNLLKIGTIVLSSILKYCAKFKKIWSRNFKVITF